MASISKRTAERLASGIKRFQPILAAIQKNRIPKRIDTGVQVVTRGNMNEPETKDLLPALQIAGGEKLVFSR